MPFQPKISITELPKSSAYFIVKDATLPYNVDTNPGGYGAPGGPANYGEVQHFIPQYQYLGEAPQEVTSTEGDMATGLKCTAQLIDGVYNIYVHYGLGTLLEWELVPDSDDLILSTGIVDDAFDIAFGNVTYISDPSDPLKIYKIKSKNSALGQLELYVPWEPVVQALLIKFYTATIKVLVLNSGEDKLVKEIGNMSLTDCGCDTCAANELMDKVMLKLVAQIEFGCKNYVKAHNAAILLNGKSKNCKPCATCK